MHRFFVPPDWISDQRARLEGGTAHQIVRVLRMSPGDEILLLDNSGQEYQVGITRLAKDVVEGNVLAVRQGQGEPGTEITLYQAVLKGSKFDLVLQKGTELGVAAFVPMICRRSIPIKQENWDRTRYPHWRKVAQEAAEQSGRSRLPLVRETLGRGRTLLGFEKP
jgi:16S rRNA (uracil1498-N3)-methyltransferase